VVVQRLSDQMYIVLNKYKPHKHYHVPARTSCAVLVVPSPLSVCLPMCAQHRSEKNRMPNVCNDMI